MPENPISEPPQPCEKCGADGFWTGDEIGEGDEKLKTFSCSNPDCDQPDWLARGQMKTGTPPGV